MSGTGDTRVCRFDAEFVTTFVVHTRWAYRQAMGRPLRSFEVGCYYHVWMRGNNRRDIYLDDADRRAFMRRLVRAVRRGRFRLHCWCLMTNHYHLVVEVRVLLLSPALQGLNSSYARAFNARHGRRDHLFGNRFGAKLIEDEEDLGRRIAYVLDNPVRAGLVGRYDQWPWSGLGRVVVRPRP